MGIAKLYGQKASGTNINGIIKDYHAYAGENISAGDLVEYINGMASSTVETSVEYQLNIPKAIELQNGNVFVVRCTGNNLHGSILTISKTAITEGASFALTTSGKAMVIGDIVELSNGNVVVLYSHTSSWYYLYGVVCTINGSTISHGSEKQINNSSYSGSCVKALVLQNDTILILHSYGSDSYVYRTYCTVSGTSITVGSSGQFLGKGYGNGRFQIEKMADDKYVFVHSSGSAAGYVYAIAFTISGTTMSSSGTDVALTSDKYSGSYGLSTCKLQNGDFIISHIYNTTNRYLKLLICSLSDLVISKRTDTTIFSEDYTGYYSVVKPVPNGSVLLLYAKRTNSLYYIYGAILTINNTTVTTGTSVQLSSNGYDSTSKEMYLLSNGSYLISYYDVYSRIIGVDNGNNIALSVRFNEYETQVRKTTTSQFDGVAKTSGVGGDETGHKDLVSIYTTYKLDTNFATRDGNAIMTADGNTFITK